MQRPQLNMMTHDCTLHCTCRERRVHPRETNRQWPADCRMEQQSGIAGKVMSCAAPRKGWLTSSASSACMRIPGMLQLLCIAAVAAVHPHQLYVHVDCRCTQWQVVGSMFSCLQNQVAVFAGVVLQYATAGAIPAALHAYSAAECQPSVRRTAIGQLVIWYKSCCGLLHMHAV